MPNGGILAETIEAIQDIAAKEIATVVIERAVVGLFFTGVKLSTGHVGACATPIKTIPDAVCCPSSAHAMPFPGKMRGRRAADFLDEVRQQDGIRRAVGIATMNALAALCWGRRPHPEVELEIGIDAFDAADIRPGQTVVVVGAFVPFLRELKRRGQPYLVLEQDPATLKRTKYRSIATPHTRLPLPLRRTFSLSPAPRFSTIRSMKFSPRRGRTLVRWWSDRPLVWCLTPTSVAAAASSAPSV